MRARRYARRSIGVLGTLHPLLPHLRGGDDVGRPHEARVGAAGRHRVLLEDADEVREGLGERPECRVVGHDDEPRRGVGHASRLGEHRRNHAGSRMRAGRQIPGDRADDRASKELGQHPVRFLVERTERVGAAIGTRHGEADARRLPDLPHRRQPSGLLLQIENGHPDRRRPEIAVAVAEPEPLRAARGVLRPNGDDLRLLGAGHRRQHPNRHHDGCHLRAHRALRVTFSPVACE